MVLDTLFTSYEGEIGFYGKERTFQHRLSFHLPCGKILRTAALPFLHQLFKSIDTLELEKRYSANRDRTSREMLIGTLRHTSGKECRYVIVADIVDTFITELRLYLSETEVWSLFSQELAPFPAFQKTVSPLVQDNRSKQELDVFLPSLLAGNGAVLEDTLSCFREEGIIVEMWICAYPKNNSEYNLSGINIQDAKTMELIEAVYCDALNVEDTSDKKSNNAIQLIIPLDTPLSEILQKRG